MGRGETRWIWMVVGFGVGGGAYFLCCCGCELLPILWCIVHAGGEKGVR